MQCERAVHFEHSAQALESLQAFLRFETICTPGQDLNVGPDKVETFMAAKQHLKDTYKAFLQSSAVTVTDVNNYSMLVEWKGTSAQLKPLLLYGHYDVVPVGADSIGSWKHGPFAGEMQDKCGTFCTIIVSLLTCEAQHTELPFPANPADVKLRAHWPPLAAA
jgi:acetylornithine deacetylase/succinyl-diaminopimelate desuccinylase-like protein